MSMPDMRNWSKEATQAAFMELEERDKVLGWNSAYVEKVIPNGHTYDE